MIDNIEILAPVGSEESLFPAVRMGADAIYLGGKNFSARKNAANFTFEQLKKAVDYCHVRNVKVYLTVNTIFKDSELESLFEFLAYAASLPVDAFIVQDLGLSLIIKSKFPGIKLHASTQMSVHTPMGAKALYNAGFSRVVLSRELSREEIKEIASACPIELEIFVHGALCMSVSGQCYFSSLLGGRSGNRGRCAQPCRMPFKVENGTGYDLSLKDLSLINYLNDMKSIGVTSAKIEGRMKRPEYVAAAVAACKKALGKNDDFDMKYLSAVFSRSGFTDGYYTAHRGKTMFGFRSKEDVLSSSPQILSSIRKMYNNEPQTIPLELFLKVKENENVKLTVNDLDGHTVTVSEGKPEKARNVPLTEDKCISQLNKMGSTPYYCNNIKCVIDDGMSFPLSKLNSLRRNALDMISIERTKRNIEETSENLSTGFDGTIEKYTAINSNINIRARFPHTNIPKIFRTCEFVYVPINSKIDDLKKLIQDGFNVAVEIPRCMFGIESKIINMLTKIKELGINDVWAGNIGAVEIAKELNMNIHGGFSLNISNTQSIKWAEQNGIKDVEVSFELNLSQISSLGGKIKRGIIAYGNLPLMITRNCPNLNSGITCKTCQGNHKLIDRKNIKFPITCNMGCTEILNSVPLYIGDKLNNIQDIDFVILRYTVENSVETEEKFRVFNNQKSPQFKITRGLYFKNVE